MKQLQHNTLLNSTNIKNEEPNIANKPNVVESSNLNGKQSISASNNNTSKQNTTSKQIRDEEDYVEQDLSDVEDNYEEPSVQRYLPGIFVDVKLKSKILDRDGAKISIPMIVDFYSECLKKYGDEKNFIYEESYLENMKVKLEDFYPEIPKPSKTQTDQNEVQPQPSLENRHLGNPDQQKTMTFEENIDDVIWLKNRPNDPLLRCIRSITDRLNIQGIVGDPTSYLKKGGDDMHYDMDDPFFDDSAMLSELKMNKSDILLNRAMEREFSDWTEDEEDDEYSEAEPEDFVADYYSNFEQDVMKQNELEDECKLYFDPSGWRVYSSKIPKQFHQLYTDFENSTKNINESITNDFLSVKIKELLESIYKKLIKIPNPIKTASKASTKTKKAKTEEVPKETVNLVKDDGPGQVDQKLEESQLKPKEESEKPVTKAKSVNNEVSKEIFKKRGLNCLLQFRLLDVNGKILRWIVKSITAMTNSSSPYEIHCEWFLIVLGNNEKIISEHSNKLKSKFTAKLQSLKPKRAESMISLLCESSRSLSKSLFIMKKLLKEHREITLPKNTKSGSKDKQELNKKKSLIEISLDSNIDDSDEYLGGNQSISPIIFKINRQIRVSNSQASLQDNLSVENSQQEKIADLDNKDENLKDNYECYESASSASSSNTEINSDPGTKIFKYIETNSEGSRVEDASKTPTANLEEGLEVQDVERDLKDKKDELEQNHDNSCMKDVNVDKNGNSGIDPNIKTPKRTPGIKDEDLDSVLKQSKIMKRVKDVYNVFKLVGNECITFVQMNNIALGVANKMNVKDFKHVVEHLGLTQNPFDQTYKRLSELGSKLIQEMYNLKVNIPTDVMKVIVINLQNHLKVEDLYEKKNKKPLLLFDNSKEKAAPGRVLLDPPKSKTPKKISHSEPSENQKTGTNGTPIGPKQTKSTPRKKKDSKNTPSKINSPMNKDETNEEVKEPQKKKKRTQPTSRVNSLKDLFLSRLRN